LATNDPIASMAAVLLVKDANVVFIFFYLIFCLLFSGQFWPAAVPHQTNIHVINSFCSFQFE